MSLPQLWEEVQRFLNFLGQVLLVVSIDQDGSSVMWILSIFLILTCSIMVQLM